MLCVDWRLKYFIYETALIFHYSWISVFIINGFDYFCSEISLCLYLFCCKALEYSKTIAKPLVPQQPKKKQTQPQTQPPWPHGVIQGLNMSDLSRLEVLKKRHEEEKKAFALLRKWGSEVFRAFDAQNVENIMTYQKRERRNQLECRSVLSDVAFPVPSTNTFKSTNHLFNHLVW